MLIHVKKQIEQTQEIKLPAYFKKSTDLYMINEQETIIRISEYTSSGIWLTTFDKNNPSNYDSVLAEAVSGESVTPYQFYKVWNKICDHLATNIDTNKKLSL